MSLLACIALLLPAACSDLAPRVTPDVTATADTAVGSRPDVPSLLREAFRNIRAGATLTMEVRHSGEPWLIATDFGDVAFESADLGFVAPDTLQVAAQVRILGLPAGVDVFARGERQWYRNPLLTGGNWQGGVLLPNFNPQQLVAAGSGFDRAASALLALEWRGMVALEDGRRAHLLRGPARGEEVSALLVNLAPLAGAVQTEVYIDPDTLLPLRFVLSQPEVATWDVKVTAVNAPVVLDAPPEAGYEAGLPEENRKDSKMCDKSPIANLRIVPVREAPDIDIRPGSINIKWRPLTIAEQLAARDIQLYCRVTSPTSPCRKG